MFTGKGRLVPPEWEELVEAGILLVSVLPFRLGVKRGINLCLFLLSLSDQLFLLSKTSAKTSKVILELAYTTEEASRWNYAMATYHLIRKVSRCCTESQACIQSDRHTDRHTDRHRLTHRYTQAQTRI